MKKLSLLIFATLILGCGNETTVVEEPEPIIEELPPVVMEEERLVPDDFEPPGIVEGTVLDGDVDVDPEPLNQDGILYKFTESLTFFSTDIFLEGKTLDWRPGGAVTSFSNPSQVGQFARLGPPANSQLLEYDTEYVIKIYVQDRACNGTEHTIRFRTKPR